MTKIRLKETTILSDEMVTGIVAGTKEWLAENVPRTLDLSAIDLEGMVRFQAVAAKCRERRQARGETIKAVGAQLKVPQYRVQDIEEKDLRSIQPAVLAAYISHLGLDRWFRDWKRANQALAQRLAPAPSGPRRAVRR